jgi:hypothetical protein
VTLNLETEPCLSPFGSLQGKTKKKKARGKSQDRRREQRQEKERQLQLLAWQTPINQCGLKD